MGVLFRPAPAAACGAAIKVHAQVRVPTRLRLRDQVFLERVQSVGVRVRTLQRVRKSVALARPVSTERERVASEVAVDGLGQLPGRGEERQLKRPQPSGVLDHGSDPERIIRSTRRSRGDGSSPQCCVAIS